MRLRTWIVPVLLLGTCGLYAVGRSRREARDAVPAEAAACPVAGTEWMEPEQLARAFHENEVAANERWKGECLRVEGPVESISDGVGGPTLKLGSGISGVRCSGIPAADLARLRKGQKVEMIGRVQGQFWDVQMLDCRLVP